MRIRNVTVLAVVSLILALAAAAQQVPAPTPILQKPLAMKTDVPPDIWQIDLVPSGSGFTLTTPVLQGDVYVFKVWPEGDVVRLPKSRVKKMVRRSTDINKEFVYQIDLLPTGHMYSRDEPKLKGGSYQFHAYRGGTLMSARQADVKSVTKVTGMDAFKLHLQQAGIKETGNLPMEGGTIVGDLSPSAAPQSPSAAAQGESAQIVGPHSNWVYYGVPGVTEAWAPPSATVSSPGDVPRLPEH
jgi:hypothetical protein